jgi:TatD DNase family protein
MGWLDSHCHLHLIEGYEVALERAREAGVEGVITVGIDLASDARVVEIAEEHEDVWVAVGIHPNDCDGFSPEMLDDLRRVAAHPRVVGVGETGLDYYREGSPRGDQIRAFKAQIALAKELSKTLVIHMRDSHEDVYWVLEEEGPPPRLVFHCFSGGAEEAKAALDLGGALSFAGNVSFPSAGELREAARVCPLEKIMVETDSPFLAPAPRRGKPNEPAFVVHVGEALSEALGRPPEQVSEATTANARRLFSM